MLTFAHCSQQSVTESVKTQAMADVGDDAVTQLTFDPSEHPHVRYNPLKNEWILVSPHRMKRPWSGQVENKLVRDIPEHDSKNPLCPRVVRANGQVNPDYCGTYVFPNDFPALKETGPINGPSDDDDHHPLLRCKPASGICRVICYHSRLDVTLSLMSKTEIRAVIDKWVEQNLELSSKYAWVQIFENRGETMGCSNPHPHCQVWASDFLPNEIAVKDETQKKYFRQYGRPMLTDYLELELNKERVVLDSNFWLTVVPYWAVWPYETMVLPKRHVLRIHDLTDDEKDDLADVFKRLLAKYDNLFEASFPYCMGWHGKSARFTIHESEIHESIDARRSDRITSEREQRSLAVARCLLSTAAQVGDGPEVHGRLRDVGTGST